MGRLSMSVDIFQILALAWDHPLIAGLLLLMFTPPFFPVLVFFSPLLISTALCAVALISMGQKIEDASKREREVTGWNARGGPADGDLPTARERTSRRRRVPGEDNWLDRVRRGLEPGSVWGQAESSMFIEDVKEERLLADFRVDEGGIDMKEEEYRQQIEAFREFERNLGERSFSFRTGAAVAASIDDALDSPGEKSSMRMVPFENATSGPQIPPMFLYTLRTGGTGSGGGSEISSSSKAVSGGQRPATQQHRQPQQLQGGHQQQHRHQHQLRQPQQQEETLASWGNGFFSGISDEQENDNQLQLQLHPESQPQQQQQKILGAFGSGFFSGTLEDNERHHHEQQQHEKMLVSLGSGTLASSFEKQKKNKQRPQQQQGELLSFGSGFIGGSFEDPGKQQYHQVGTSSQMQVSSAEAAHLSMSIAKSSSSSHKPVKYSYEDSRVSDRKTSTGDFGGDRGDGKPKPSQVKALTYNANLISGNAVIYSAEPPPIDTKQLQKRNSLSNRERRSSSTTQRQRRKHEMAARHALQLEKENSLAGNWMTTNAARRE